MHPPIRIHPEHSKIFEFRGRPTVLVTACEHYGGVMNRPFDFDRHLTDCQQVGINYTRLFTLFRELQSAANPYSTCKPESTDYVAPWERTGPGRALDLQPQYDLTRWNPEFQDRLHGFLSRAAACDVVVELVLFSNTYGPENWSLNPLHAANNVNGLEAIPWFDYNTRRHPKLLAVQEAYARRMVEEVNRYDNVILEICNEPGGGTGIPGSPDPDEVNDWLDHFLRLVRQTEATLPHRHLIAGQEAFAYKLPDEAVNPRDVHQFCARSFGEMDVDAVNLHPLSNMPVGNRRYDLGRFMHAQLHLHAYRDYCLELYAQRKPLTLDEDNCATQYRDPTGWNIHRKRAWTALFCGAHYNMIDFAILPGREMGTEASQRGLREPIGHAARFLHTFDLLRARPLPDAVLQSPEPACTSAFGVDGHDVAVYLADPREIDAPGHGAPIGGALTLRIPDGDYRLSCTDPLTGMSSPQIACRAQRGTLECVVPEFVHDRVVRVQRATQ